MPKVSLTIRIPQELSDAMPPAYSMENGRPTGERTAFVVEAIREKLEREKSNE